MGQEFNNDTIYELSDVMKEALQELDYMEEHPEEYKSYDNLEKLKVDLLSNE